MDTLAAIFFALTGMLFGPGSFWFWLIVFGIIVALVACGPPNDGSGKGPSPYNIGQNPGIRE